MILSFGWTEQYLPPNGPKDTTRRVWSARHLASWQKAWDEGRLEHDAANKCLAYGGKKIGRITLTERPTLETLAQMPEADLIREGGMCDSVEEFIDRYFRGDRSVEVAVVRFQYKPFWATVKADTP